MDDDALRKYHEQWCKDYARITGIGDPSVKPSWPEIPKDTSPPVETKRPARSDWVLCFCAVLFFGALAAVGMYILMGIFAFIRGDHLRPL